MLGITRSTSGLPGDRPGLAAAHLRRRRDRRVRGEAEPGRHGARLRVLPRQHRHRGAGQRRPIAVDGQGRAFVTGITNSASTFPGGAGAHDPARERRQRRHVRHRAGAERHERRLHRRARRHRRRQQPRRDRAQPGRQPVRHRRDDVGPFTGVGAGSLQPTKGAGQDGFVAKIVAATQAIAFTSTPPSPAAVGGSYAVAATGGGSGNPVVFSVDAASTPGACSLAGSTVHFDHVGTCVVDANQAGNDDYPAAPQAQQTFAIEKGTPVLTWPQPAQIAFGTPLGAAQLDPTASVAGHVRLRPARGHRAPARARTRSRRRSRPRARPTTTARRSRRSSSSASRAPCIASARTPAR